MGDNCIALQSIGDPQWEVDKRYVEAKLEELKENQEEAKVHFERVNAILVEIRTDLLSYKRVANILMAVAAGIGSLITYALEVWKVHKGG